MFFYPDPTPEISRAGGNDEEKIKRSVRLALLKTYGVLPALAGILWSITWRREGDSNSRSIFAHFAL